MDEFNFAGQLPRNVAFATHIANFEWEQYAYPAVIFQNLKFLP